MGKAAGVVVTNEEIAKYVTVPGGDELLCRAELSVAMKRTPRYISAMVRDGFPMPGGRATLNQALVWLVVHPGFRQNRPPQEPAGRPPPLSVWQTDISEFYSDGIRVRGEIKG